MADAGYGDVTAFREELEKRQLRYAVGVQSTTGVWVEPPASAQIEAEADRASAQLRRTTVSSGLSRSKKLRSKPKAGRKFAGEKAAKVG